MATTLTTHRTRELSRRALTCESDGTPFRWLDPDRIMHATLEWPFDPENPDGPIGLTRCSMYEIVQGESWSGYDELTCRQCLDIENDDLARGNACSPQARAS